MKTEKGCIIEGKCHLLLSVAPLCEHYKTCFKKSKNTAKIRKRKVLNNKKKK